jgi:hypothetical protein
LREDGRYRSWRLRLTKGVLQGLLEQQADLALGGGYSDIERRRRDLIAKQVASQEVTSYLRAIPVCHDELSPACYGRDFLRYSVRPLELLPHSPEFSGPDQGVSAQGNHQSAAIRHEQEHTLALSLRARTVTVR